MAKSGCKEISIGVESGNQEILEKYNKRLDLDKVFEGARIMRDVGIVFDAFIMLGHPDEDEKSLKKSELLLEKINARKSWIFILTPFPGSKFYNQLRAEGRIIEANWDRYLEDNTELLFKHDKLDSKTLQKYLVAMKYKFDRDLQKQTLSLVVFIKALKLAIYYPGEFLEIIGMIIQRNRRRYFSKH